LALEKGEGESEGSEATSYYDSETDSYQSKEEKKEDKRKKAFGKSSCIQLAVRVMGRDEE
jgi:hypothetical protein